MIDRIKGKCLRKSPTAVVVEIGGIGLSLAVSLSSFEQLGPVGSEVSLLTYLHVREDALELYGFMTVDERDLFASLIKVSGVGPRMALAIQSRFSPGELFQVVADADIKRLTTVKGIGRKTAERLMVELKGRLDVRIVEELAPISAGISAVSEAVQALEALGFTLQQADDAIRQARKTVGEDAPVEELVRNALKG